MENENYLQVVPIIPPPAGGFSTQATGITPPEAQTTGVTPSEAQTAVSNGFQFGPQRWNFCAQCGTKLEACWKHCPNCGIAIGFQGLAPYHAPYPWERTGNAPYVSPTTLLPYQGGIRYSTIGDLNS
jgi:hypothetical protein